MGALDSERLEYPIQLTEDADLKLEQFFLNSFFPALLEVLPNVHQRERALHGLGQEMPARLGPGPRFVSAVPVCGRCHRDRHLRSWSHLRLPGLQTGLADCTPILEGIMHVFYDHFMEMFLGMLPRLWPGVKGGIVSTCLWTQPSASLSQFLALSLPF